MLPDGDSLEEVRNRFRWEIPDVYNIATDVCDRWAEKSPDQVAIIHEENSGITEVTYGQLQRYGNQLSNLLGGLGIRKGDRIGIMLPQHPWTAIAHIAAWKMAAISIPLFTLFGRDALEYRLLDSEARVVITNLEGIEKLEDIRSNLPGLEHILCVDSNQDGDQVDIDTLSARQSDHFDTVATRADDPALIVYTSGTTGNPKGALHAHRTMLGHLPGVEMSHDFLPQPGDLIWTPADWAWIGGLMDVLMPALYHGVPVISRRFEKFSGEAAFELINRHRVRNAFLPPTALKMMRASNGSLQSPMRTIASAGEALGGELLAWGREVLGLSINEFYGQTECNMIVSACAKLSEPRPGVMGYAAPGHDVQVISDSGAVLERGEVGDIAIRMPDPVAFLGYWNSPDRTREKYRGDWLVTGDKGVMEIDGALRFLARDDDVITSSGYRIGPGEIENCLLGHPAVAMAGVVGKPDPDRTEIVKAFIKLNDGFRGSAALATEIQDWVKSRLSAHEYPREVAFIEDFPLTTTSKIIRRKLRDLN